MRLFRFGKTLWLLALLLVLPLGVPPAGPAGAADSAVASVPARVSFAIPAVTEEQQASELPNILVIGTGGTISGQSADETSFQTYRAGSLPIGDMVAALPNLDWIADVSTFQFGNKGSGSYTIPELYDLSLAVDQGLQDYDGVVVTTGTDTMEEIGYFLDLTIRSQKPVVITGSMRPWTVIGSDAPANLFNAIKLAASGKTARFGVVLMLNDEIHSIREVTKTNTYRLDTFQSPMLGILGYIDESRVRIYRVPARALKPDDEWATPFDLRKITKDQLAKVEIVYSYQGAGGEAIRAFVEAGAKGIVTAGTGAGGISAAMREERDKAIQKGVVFVSTSRTGSGSVYGSGEGILAGDNLNPAHARILLLLILSFTDDFETVKKWFAKYGVLEAPERLPQKSGS